EAYARVEAADVVAATRKLVDRAEEAYEVLLAHVALEAEDADRRVLVEHTEERAALRDERVALLLVADAGEVGGGPYEVAVVVREVAGRVVGGVEDAVCVSPALARELQGEVGVNDCARVDGGDERAEDVNAFEEEGALLLEKDGEALVRRVDGRVGLDLREVRVDGEVNGRRRRHDE